jgi:membrane-bound lytic murein transglycosylase D
MMFLKKLTFSLLGISLAFALSAQQNQVNNAVLLEIEDAAEDTSITMPPDTVISAPKEYDSVLDDMLHSWLITHADTSDCTTGESPTGITDDVYKLRLSKMPCIMEMPYNNSVRAFIEHYTVKKRRQMEYMLGISEYYFPIFEQELEANGLPLELRYLPIIESALNTTITSRAGAAGLWQFMIATGRLYGLEVNSLVDERLEPHKASAAAARFLKDLYRIYGDWSMVIAAYNCGPGNVNKAIRRSGGKRDYWAIYPYLPAETRGYVPIFIAANYSMNYAAEHNICKINVKMPLITDTVMLSERVHLDQIAAVLGLPVEEVQLLNPQYRKKIVPGNIKPYPVRLPLNYATQFIDKYSEILAYNADSLINNRRVEALINVSRSASPGDSGRTTWHTVKKGQTLSHIASRYGVSVKRIKQWNNLTSDRLRVGQKIKISK